MIRKGNPRTDPSLIPADVRRKAFAAAMLAFQTEIRAAGYDLDAIAELEAVDLELGRAAGFEPEPGGRHDARLEN